MGSRISQSLFDELGQDLREVRRAPADRPVVLGGSIEVDRAIDIAVNGGPLTAGCLLHLREDELQHVVHLLRRQDTRRPLLGLQRDPELSTPRSTHCLTFRNHETGLQGTPKPSKQGRG